MNVTNTTFQYIGLSLGISLLLIAVVAICAYIGNLSLIEYSLIFVTAGPLFASIALAKFYFDSKAPQPTWPQLFTMLAISFPILLGCAFVVYSTASYIMISILIESTIEDSAITMGQFFVVQARPLMNATFAILLGVLFIFPKQVEVRRKKAGV